MSSDDGDGYKKDGGLHPQEMGDNHLLSVYYADVVSSQVVFIIPFELRWRMS